MADGNTTALQSRVQAGSSTAGVQAWRGVTTAQAARDLGLHVNVLRGWVREHRADPGHAFPGVGQPKPESAEVTQLRREVARLKMERDILKKLR